MLFPYRIVSNFLKLLGYICLLKSCQRRKHFLNELLSQLLKWKYKGLNLFNHFNITRKRKESPYQRMGHQLNCAQLQKRKYFNDYWLKSTDMFFFISWQTRWTSILRCWWYRSHVLVYFWFIIIHVGVAWFPIYFGETFGLFSII